MRTDGCVSYFIVQHKDTDGRWVDTALERVLFEGMTDTDKRSAYADYCRELLAPQSASSDLWQTFGIHGFKYRMDAEHVLHECSATDIGRYFRIVRRTSFQDTFPV